ncbi:hypothetical protein DFH09DRAFT_1348807 [Mycena vulgaris]|nr:hypothetical protein DFH09DRAFT_1348807 [Mycena vulgaris]
MNGKKQRKRHDSRKRWDSVERRVLGFRGQMRAMTDAYMKWAATQGEYGMESAPEPVDPDDIEKVYKVRAIDVFGTYIVNAPMRHSDGFTTSCLVGQGLIPVQSWMKTLADLHGLDFKPYTAQQFTVCFDVYLEILQNLDARVKKALGRNAAEYRLKNNCPACTYKLEGEAKLIFEMLMTSDGNDSLKRVLRKEQDFIERLEQEKAYLKGLSKEPEAETQQMEYYQSETFDIVFAEGSKENGMVKRHARENFDKAMTVVQEIERRLEVQTRWTPGSKEWQDAALLAASRRYRLSVNWLETLVVRRLFELTKMNMSQTGYKLRKHIAKALQVSAALTPRSRSLTWAEVIDYAFLSDFDILRDPDGNAALRPWADPAAHHLMDCFFKIERAREEITRLNIEIQRLVTYIRDEKEVLLEKESEVNLTDPHLAFFISKYRLQRGRLDETHMKRLCTMVKKLGSRFTGTLVPGVRCEEEVEEEEGAMDVDGDNSVAAAEVEAAAVAAEIERGRAEEAQFLDGVNEWEDVEDDDEGEIPEGEGLAEMTERVVTVATDKLNGERG